MPTPELKDTEAPDALRVLHIIDHLRLGGAQTFLRDLVTHQHASPAIEPSVCCLTQRAELADRFEEIGTPIHVLGVERGNPVQVATIPWRIGRLLRRRPVDLVHTHLFASAALGRTAAWAAGIPIVNHEHCNETTAASDWMKGIDRLLGKVTDLQICVSASTRTYNIRAKGIEPNRLVVIPTMVNPQRFSPDPTGRQRRRLLAEFGLPDETQVVMGIGRLERQKRFDIFLRAAQIIAGHAERVAFFIVGEGSLNGRLERLAESLGIGRYVHFTGVRHDVPALLQGSDLFLLTSDFEGMPITLLEALATAVPVVATGIDGTQEVLQGSQAGCLVPPRDPDGTAAAVLRLLGSPAERKACGQAGRQLIEQRYTPHLVAGQIQQVYREVMDRRAQTVHGRALRSRLLLGKRDR